MDPSSQSSASTPAQDDPNAGNPTAPEDGASPTEAIAKDESTTTEEPLSYAQVVKEAPENDTPSGDARSTTSEQPQQRPTRTAHFAVEHALQNPPTRPSVTSAPSLSRTASFSTPAGPIYDEHGNRIYTAPSWHTLSRRSSSTNVSPTRSRSNKKDKDATNDKPSSLRDTLADLRSLLKTLLIFIPSSFQRLSFLIPPPLRRLSRSLLARLAMSLHKRGALASNVVYDIMVFLWKSTIDIFFREIRSRGGWKVPRDGGIIFVVGPHHNQFLDPLLLMSEVRRESGRRISFLVAEASMQRKFIGQAASLMQSISVVRAQDLAAGGPGTISLPLADSDDPLVIIGHGTSFLADLGPKKQLMLGRHFGNATVEVVEVIDDTHVKVKKEFGKKASEGLREAGEQGTSYKILPHVDQSRMYSSVYKKLSDGGCIGIFPEGGSHDRTDLLPLKAGVSIMALGALSSNRSLKLRVVPVGLSYFHPHRFRSRAVVEFGGAIEIPDELVNGFESGGEDKKAAIGKMMELVVDGLKSVTVRAPDYETLMLIQATRRLYRPPGQHLTLGQIVELNKRFIAGYEVYKEEPALKELRSRVQEYNTLLRYMGLKDHQIDRVPRPIWKSLLLLVYRFGLVAAWSLLALPGVILNAPIFIAATIISRKKAKLALAKSTVKIKGNDVLATWKVLVALAGAPTLYTIYAIGAAILAHKMNLPRTYKIWAPVATLIGLPCIGFSALRFGEVGMDVYKSLRPLFLSVMPGNERQLDKLRTMRTALQHDINEIVNHFGPQLFEDFQATRILPPTSVPAPAESSGRKRSTYGPNGQGTFLTHPMTWVDEYLFGWSQSQVLPRATGANGTESDANASEPALGTGYVSGYTTDEPGDYDEVIHILSREQAALGGDVVEGQVAGGEGKEAMPQLRRRNSRGRSRSQLDLTKLDTSLSSPSSAGKKAE